MEKCTLKVSPPTWFEEKSGRGALSCACAHGLSATQIRPLKMPLANAFADESNVDIIPSPLTAAIAAFRELLVVYLEGAICLRRRVRLASSHIGRHRMELEDLVLRDGHEVPGKDQEIRQLSGFDGTLHLLFPSRERIVGGSDAQRLFAADFFVRSEHASVAGLTRHVVVEWDERIVG